MRARLILSYILISLAALLVMFVYLHLSLKRMFSEQTVSKLVMKARMNGQHLSNTLPTNFSYDTVDEIVDNLDTEDFVRITFIDPSGTVWGDTAFDGDALKEMDNLQDRPEIQTALAEGKGDAIRFSDIHETEIRYFAIPVLRESLVIGVCRVAIPVHRMPGFSERLRSTYILAIGIGLASTLILGLIAAKIVTSPIRRFLRTAKLIADGRISVQVSNNSSDELGRLTQHFSQMADRVKHQIHEISQERDRLETILANMVEGVLLIDENFAIVYANPAAVLMLNLSADYRGNPLIEIIRDPRLQGLLTKSQDTRESAFAELKLVGTAERETEITAVPVVDEYLVVIHDVSQLRKLERVRVDFVTNVSHEIRTPLTSIQGFAETLLTGALNDSNTNRRFVEKILQQSSALSQFVTDLLDLSRLESGMATLTLEPCELGAFRAPLLNLLGPVFDDAKLTFDWEVADDMPLVMVDKRLMEQTFTNLIDNAIKYTSPGGKITVSSSISDSEVVVHIRDTGIGISSDMLPRIFERFYRVDKARSSEIRGTGLGLAIAKHILLQHDGRIWAESVLGEGSVFHFALPLRQIKTTNGHHGTRP
jgi:two-component system phosphate regulon sensor histidine kinase PhoR